MKIGSLFSGIGGLELGLERAGLGRVVWQVEQNAWCRGVLARHWPEAIRHEDVRQVGRQNLEPVDVVCGGFPCQDISFAGKGAGLEGARSGLWYEYRRIVEELRPRAVVVENVAALRRRGLTVVREGLRDLGYRVVPCPVSASDVGAPHGRARLFVIAWRPLADPGGVEPERWGGSGDVACASRAAEGEGNQRQRRGDAALHRDEAVGDANGARLEGHGRPIEVERAPGPPAGPRAATGAGGGRGHGPAQPVLGGMPDGISAGVDRVRRAGYRWPLPQGLAQHPWEPPRTARGVVARADRIKALGNAVVPQVAEAVGYFVRDLLAG